ncbi:hypothetical protein SAMN05216369_0644 [Marinobacter antarcticus]|uniref:Uncharacterized protein n=1 Tax=Marinobacter antarcticus TaxID=564117 RepID=A0A1M6Q1Y6_9GAMM|nr:hypothetical protein [Marinobacter antarcticus]SHK14131.1 hypothetical protein SAMN05216369_0644 [Marinobacter antarcticus]
MSKLELVDKYATRGFLREPCYWGVVMLSDLAISFFELEIEPLVLFYDSIFTIVMAVSIGTSILQRIIEMF